MVERDGGSQLPSVLTELEAVANSFSVTRNGVGVRIVAVASVLEFHELYLS